MSFSESFSSHHPAAPSTPIAGTGFSTKFSPNRKSELVEKGLEMYMQTKISKHALRWGTINVMLLSILLFDLSNRCPFDYSRWFYVEGAVALLIGCSVIYYFTRYFYFLFSFEPVKGTDEQRRLLQFPEGDSSFVITKQEKLKVNSPATPANVTILSWHSSMNDSNRSVTSPGWTYNRGSPPHQMSFNQSCSAANASWRSFQNTSSLNATQNSSAHQNSAVFSSPYQKYSKEDIITDEAGLQKFLKLQSARDAGLNATTDNANDSLDRSSMNSFWNYCNNAANLLKTSLYQMAPTTSAVSPQKNTASSVPPSSLGAANKDENAIGVVFNVTDIDGHSDEIKRICASGLLSQYIYNIRTWIACTILHRLASEIEKTNDAFEKRGFADIQIGRIALDRLKKTADNQQLVAAYAPMLPMIVPFLDIATNQEYVVQRIRDLSKGCVLAEYRWNSGGLYNGLGWDEHLPTDAAIIFHLFCVYLDSQLRPLPQPGGRPFYDRYVIFGDKKSTKEILAEYKEKCMKCALLFTNTTKPQFNFISNDKIHNCVQDRNNLFYVMVEFLIFMKKNNDGLLQGVNLGLSGINLLSTIGG